VQRLWLEAPVALEVIRSGIDLRAAEIENAAAALAGPAHQRPVLVVVGREFARGGQIAGVVRQNLVAKVEAQYRRHGSALRIDDRLHFAIAAERRQQCVEVAARQRGGSMALDVVRVQIEEPSGIAIDLRFESALDPLAHHRALLARDGQQIGFDLGRQFLAKGHVQRLLRPFGFAPAAVAQFEMRDAQAARDLERRRMQRRDRTGIVGGHPGVRGERQ
jgi:hypothetical protein